MFIERSLNPMGGIRLIHTGGNEQLSRLDGIKIELISNRLEGRVVSCAVERHSCVHLLLEQCVCIVVWFGRLSTTTGFSFSLHFLTPLFVSVTNYIYAHIESRVDNIPNILHTAAYCLYFLFLSGHNHHAFLLPECNPIADDFLHATVLQTHSIFLFLNLP